MRAYSTNARVTSKRGNNKIVMVFARFDVLRALSEYAPTTKWNLLVLLSFFLLSLTHDVIRFNHTLLCQTKR